MTNALSKVFISYSRQDGDFAWKLARDLRSVNVSVWLDQNDIPPGAAWDLVVEEALKSCQSMIVVLTPNSVESQEVRSEVNFVYAAKKTIYPCYVDECEVPYRWQSLNRIDFSERYDEGFAALADALSVEPTVTEKFLGGSVLDRGITSDGDDGSWGSEHERELSDAIGQLDKEGGEGSFLIATDGEHYAQCMRPSEGTIYAEIVSEEFLSTVEASSGRAKTLEGLGFILDLNYAGTFEFDGTERACMKMAQLMRQALSTAYGISPDAILKIQLELE